MMSQLCPVNDFGGNGAVMHFVHANGYPPGVYRAFLSALAEQYRVLAPDMRPLWQPPCDPSSVKDWSVFSEDIIHTLDADSFPAETPVIGVGHSLGAFATLIAAVRRPELFSALVLMEPPFLGPGRRLGLSVFSRFARHRIPLIGRTLRRRDHWPSLDEAYNHFRRKRVFARIPDDVLQDVVQYGTRSDNQHGRVLTFSKEWEAQIYTTISKHARLIQRCRVPVMAVRGAETDTLTPAVWRQWQRLASPGDKFLEVPDTGHLLPLERPERVAATVCDYLPALLRDG